MSVRFIIWWNIWNGWKTIEEKYYSDSVEIFKLGNLDKVMAEDIFNNFKKTEKEELEKIKKLLIYKHI